MTDQPMRPVMRYHGGKWLLAPWVISHFPRHRVYVEPYGGGASVLLRKPRAHSEIYNDLGADVVNVFRVLRDSAAAERLRRLIELTPFSRDEFEAAFGTSTDPVEAARQTIVRSFMGFGSASVNRAHKTGFRAGSRSSGASPAGDWARWPAEIPAFVERMRGVIIDNRCALEVIRQQDGPHTLFYVDPPYPHHTRSGNAGVRQKYTHEMGDDDHRAMAKVLRAASGMVVLSGYPTPLYDAELFSDWARYERRHLADGARPRTEVLWLNPACAAAIDRQSGLFAAGGAA